MVLSPFEDLQNLPSARCACFVHRLRRTSAEGDEGGGEGGGGGNAVEAEPALQGWLEPKALPEVLQHHLGDSDSLLQDARLCPAIEHTSSMRLHHSN